LKVVVNELVHAFIRRGDACLARMDAALARRDHMEYLNALYEGFGAHVKSYEQAKQTSDDMLKAVVVYMALLLPFCLFLEKLLFKFVRIEQEMAAFALMFVATFMVFRAIHPAFRIAQGAEAIFIAFVMGALGLFVIGILRGRFDGTMQMIFRSYMADDIGYSTVTQKAMLIGVNNMKRRRTRTMLTTATIVLVAFTMLSFTSVSKTINPTLVAKSKTAPYTGFMYHWTGKYPMDESTLAALTQIFHGRGETVVRRWLLAEDQTPLPVANRAGDIAQFEGVLGLPMAEHGFLGPLPLVAGRYFSSDEAREAVLSSEAAEFLNIAPGELGKATVSIQGETLTVVGIIDGEQFRALRDLNGLPLTPILRLLADGADQKQTKRRPSGGSSMRSDVEDMGSLFFANPDALLIMPVNTARRWGAQPYSISLKLPDNEPIWPVADLLLTITRARFYMSSRVPFTPAAEGERQTVSAGVYYIGSNYSTSVGGLAALIIPLFIASTIILNTMLGSVYERKKEIAVFNAIGLNPHHIGTFFLAESFVYGIIGSVGGYLIGQALSLIIAWTGWIGDLNFNYSSLSVAYVILFTIAIVLLSTLYPAMAATKAAVPSGKRTWSLPPHDGRVMRVRFPFIYQERVAVGVLAYLREYFDRFSEASIGDMIASFQEQAAGRDGAGRAGWTLNYHTALAPFDLGVTQDASFALAFDEQVQAYCLIMTLTRVSGQDSNWVTCNRPFLERLRKYLMRWRNLNAAQQDLYIRHARETLESER
ncbi:MAG: FtsX-like permease family protein, partial [Kiritimatiellae bacterium]|nr:FtsX-like permease family protein [Kiritimatiellia bacterium]